MLYEEFFEELDSMFQTIVREYESNIGNSTYRQQWDLIPAHTLIKTWNDFINLGIVRNEKAVYNIADIVIQNIQKIYVNNILTGHEQYNPEEYAGSLLDKDYPDGYFEKLEDFFNDDNGSLRISDYAINKLVEKAIELKSTTEPEEKLRIIDSILHIVHQRSDLASWFVAGGSKTLAELSSAPKQ
jgi:hypothetical protein